MKTKLIGLLIVSQLSCAFAANVNMINATMNVRNLTTSMSAIQMTLQTPAVFPASIPAPSSAAVTYYASVNLNLPNKSIKYILNVDATAQCHGAQFCNIGRVMAQTGVAPKSGGQGSTKTVDLANQVVGFYTSGYAAGDYSPAQLQWLNQNTLYTLTWKMPRGLSDADQQQLLVQMANSALANQNQ